MTGVLSRSVGELLGLLCADEGDPRQMPVTVVVAAHPDDEVIGVGTRLPRLGDAVFVHVTDGSPRNEADALAKGFSGRAEYAAARRRELDRALEMAGIGPRQALELGCPDQEASVRLADLAWDLRVLFAQLRAEAVITHPYEGGHPDHDATAFAVHAACRLLERQGAEPPALIEMTSYHMGCGGIETGTFLSGNGLVACDEGVALVLSAHERAFKRRLLDCFATQRETLQYFDIEVERFRAAPRYDFTCPPHEGKLFYEMFPWGMTGACFRGLAHEAMEQLGITGSI